MIAVAVALVLDFAVDVTVAVDVDVAFIAAVAVTIAVAVNRVVSAALIVGHVVAVVVLVTQWAVIVMGNPTQNIDEIMMERSVFPIPHIWGFEIS